MRTILCALTVCGTILYGCADPMNRATSHNYTTACAAAERSGRYDVAEQACYRALANVDWVNLPLELQSRKMYNLARIKKQLSKHDEAEVLLKQALALEEELPQPSDIRIGRRLIELSANLAGQGKWSEGAAYLKRALPILGQYSGSERNYADEVIALYGAHFLRKSGDGLASLNGSRIKTP